MPDDAPVDLGDQREPHGAVRAQRVDDAALERLVEGGVVDRADGREIARLFLANGNHAR